MIVAMTVLGERRVQQLRWLLIFVVEVWVNSAVNTKRTWICSTEIYRIELDNRRWKIKHYFE